MESISQSMESTWNPSAKQFPGIPRPFLVPEIILSQNIFLPTTQGPDMKNIFCVTLAVKIYFVKV